MINTMAKKDMVEDVRAVYGDATAEQIERSSTITVVEILVVDQRGDEHVLEPICKVK